MTLNIRSRLKKSYNHKRIYRLMKSVHMQSVIRRKKKRYAVTEPRITAESLLNREFTAETPNQKWLTDITEFKLCNGKKAYLSAILDLADNSIVSYVLGHSGNNQLVFDTLDKAMQANPTAHPLFHSDRGITYTNRQFKAMLDKIHATQSMSRPGRCIDNGPLRKAFGAFSKQKCIIYSSSIPLRNYGRTLMNTFFFYNTKRLQSKLKGLAPLDFRKQTLAA